MSAVVDVGLWLLNQNFEIPAVLVLGANPFRVLLEFGGIVRLRENILEENRMRHADRLEVLHRTTKDAAFNVLVPFENNLAHLHLRSFFDCESKAHGVWRNGVNLGTHGGELSAMLSQQLLDGDLGLLHFGGIVL